MIAFSYIEAARGSTATNPSVWKRWVSCFSVSRSRCTSFPVLLRFDPLEKPSFINEHTSTHANERMLETVRGDVYNATANIYAARNSVIDEPTESGLTERRMALRKLPNR